MNSIDHNQAENSFRNLYGPAAVGKLKELIKETETCFFCTSSSGQGSHGVRPMGVQQVDDYGNLWFLSAADSHKNGELERDPAVKLFFQGGKHSEFLHLEGTATVSRDKAKIKELWKFLLKTWFTEGEDDPRITVIKVAPTSAYYWDTKHGDAVAGVKMLIGATLGKTLDDSVQGSLSV